MKKTIITNLLRLSGTKILFGIFLALGLLVGIWRNAPDGKLHVVFCSVGQGDAIYMRLPDQTDILVDGGPNDRVISCLGRHMPFYDRTLDIVVLTHPQKDHLQGLIPVLHRYQVKNLVTVPVAHTTEGYKEFISLIFEKNVPVRPMTRGGRIRAGKVNLEILWPDREWLADTLAFDQPGWQKITADGLESKLHGFATNLDLNMFSLYHHLKYGNFDLLLTGDGDQKVQEILKNLDQYKSLPADIEVLKVPHHGSRTALTEEVIQILSPSLSVIQVGKNQYGHPHKDTIENLQKQGKIMTTEKQDIEIVSDGKNWRIL